MPSGSTWRCRFDHVDVRETLFMRAVQCSSDGWRTIAGDTANAPRGRDSHTLVASANVELYDNGRSVGSVSIVPCMPDDASSCGPPAPELP
jgi:hypothetical protein